MSVLSIYSAVLVLFKGLRLLFIPKVPEAIFIPESRLSNEGLFFLGGIDFGTNEIVSSIQGRVSVQGVKSLGGHFACLCRGFEFYEVSPSCYFFMII